MVNGQLRWYESFKRTFQQNLQPSLAGHNVQYFVYFWNQGFEDLSKFIDLCNPVILHSENQKSILEIQEFLGYKKNISVKSIIYQSYTMYKVFLLLQQYQQQHNMMFDLFIRMRPDLAFISKIDINNFDQSSIYFKSLAHEAITLDKLVNDYIYFTRSFDTVKKMAMWGFCLDAILDDPKSFQWFGAPTPADQQDRVASGIYVPEELLARYISRENISAKTYDFNIDLARHHPKENCMCKIGTVCS